jgi:hypothetical protein
MRGGPSAGLTAGLCGLHRTHAASFNGRQAVGSCGPQYLFHLAPRSVRVWGFLSRQRWWMLEAEECLSRDRISDPPNRFYIWIQTSV